jgi:hypothetical protein
MSEQGWSWVRALESGALTEQELAALQELIDDGDAETLLEAASLLDHEERNRPDTG